MLEYLTVHFCMERRIVILFFEVDGVYKLLGVGTYLRDGESSGHLFSSCYQRIRASDSSWCPSNSRRPLSKPSSIRSECVGK